MANNLRDQVPNFNTSKFTHIPAHRRYSSYRSFLDRRKTA